MVRRSLIALVVAAAALLGAGSSAYAQTPASGTVGGLAFTCEGSALYSDGWRFIGGMLGTYSTDAYEGNQSCRFTQLSNGGATTAGTHAIPLPPPGNDTRIRLEVAVKCSASNNVLLRLRGTGATVGTAGWSLGTVACSNTGWTVYTGALARMNHNNFYIDTLPPYWFEVSCAWCTTAGDWVQVDAVSVYWEYAEDDIGGGFGGSQPMTPEQATSLVEFVEGLHAAAGVGLIGVVVMASATFGLLAVNVLRGLR